jgi:Ser/Thr protein kinase RdoA (MazF antagonist)
MFEPFIKRRAQPIPGSIPDVLQMFVAEVRFYREIAPVVGVRVPECLQAEENAGATLLVLENLSDWKPGAEPTEAARVLAGMHERWQGAAAVRWSWLRAPDAATDLVGNFFDEAWPTVTSRPECTPEVRALGERLYGHIPAVERAAAKAGPTTLVHGDASMLNLRTSPAGEIALLDWEDVGAAPGVSDLAWLLVSSIDPIQWDETIAAYGSAAGLSHALPAAASQAILSLADTPRGSDEAGNWVGRIEEATRRLN